MDKIPGHFVKTEKDLGSYIEEKAPVKETKGERLYVRDVEDSDVYELCYVQGDEAIKYSVHNPIEVHYPGLPSPYSINDSDEFYEASSLHGFDGLWLLDLD